MERARMEARRPGRRPGQGAGEKGWGCIQMGGGAGGKHQEAERTGLVDEL